MIGTLIALWILSGWIGGVWTDRYLNYDLTLGDAVGFFFMGIVCGPFIVLIVLGCDKIGRWLAKRDSVVLWRKRR